MRLRRLAALAVVPTLLLSACGGAGDDDGSVTLRVATGLSENHVWWDSALEPWMERVEELSDGAVTFETFTGGELVEVPDEVEAVRNGTVDIALILPIYTPDQFPMAEVAMLPTSQSDAIVASEAWRALIEDDATLGDATFYDSEYADKDLKVLPLSATQEYSISTVDKELDSVDAIRGTSLRTASRIHEIYADEIGVDSVTIPAVDMFDALSRGAFDGSFYPYADWSGYGFQDLFKNTLTDLNFGHFNALIGMNQSTWDDLPEGVADAMTQAHDEIFLQAAEEYEKRAAEMVEENEAVGGTFVSVNDLDPEVRTYLEGGVEETWNRYIELLEEEGLPGRELALRWRDLVVEAGGEVPDAIADLD